MKVNSILLVDDDEATNYINQLLIKRADITDQLFTVHNGKEAIDFIKQRLQSVPDKEVANPKLILLDINMPVMDGFGFLQAYEQLDFPGKGSVEIAVLTTSLYPRDLERAQAFGISNFLSKPLTTGVLKQLVSSRFNKS